MRFNVPVVADETSESADAPGEGDGPVGADGGLAAGDAANSPTHAGTPSSTTPPTEPGASAPPGAWTPPPTQHTRTRRIFANSIIGVATVLLIAGVFAVWANRLLFSPDNWSNTSTQLLQSPTIRAAISNYAVDQLYKNVDVGDLIKSALPARLQPLADPAAGALRTAAVQGVDAALTQPLVQDLWARANRAAGQTFVVVVEGGKGPVGVKQGVVTLDLASIVDSVASRLGLPPNLGAKLPPHIANLTVLKSDQLKLVQNGGNFLRHLAVWLTVLVPVLYALALAVAPAGRRRRTLMTVGFTAIFGGLVVILGRTFLVDQVTGSLVQDASLEPAVSDVVTIMTKMLHQIAAGVIFMGVLLVIAAWIAGPARAAYAARRAVAPFLRERPAASYAIMLGLLALLFILDPIHATGTPVGILVFTLVVLSGLFVLRRQTAEEFPDEHLGDTTRRVRGRIDRWRRDRRRRQQSEEARASTTTSLTDELRELADLRERGVLEPDEYETAKAHLLAGDRGQP